MKAKINVTKTFLPSQEEYQSILKRAWDTGWMTNRGVLVKELELKLKEFLGVSNIIAMTNGTLPIQIAIKGLGLKGEIITTPFTYVATTAAIVWESCTPVFVDIHPTYLTIDETKIEAAITSETSAILATHVYGNPCHVEEIDRIARKYDLKVIYDAAHCFGVKYKGESIFNYGDVSTCSFHATKLFHTGEGGALFCKSEYYDQFFQHHNFGHEGPEAFYGLGINAKMSELQAAMGLVVLPYMSEIMDRRKRVINLYQECLGGSNIDMFHIRDKAIWNYAYFPVMFESVKKLLEVKQTLEINNIYPRRYFFPTMDTLPYLRQSSCYIARDVSRRILCLPLHDKLTESDILRITSLIV
ncbi:DegT/DnrJ/EryC1/StrS family aminotransferase [Winogradskyella aurantiaca]|uniref:DegT/DnrJ/EryC1/StrS family aminotransferase n=1 Tax=Winogradskyella aurantiaca TaxID=2219558 RepID=UPI000E1DF5F9|nr:DegT/DnrJ/EryC1/StrS family aminotransferase [Winogradskyella aurantiaca]